MTGSPSAQLYPTEIVRGRTPFYDVELWHEDTDAAFRTLAHWDLGFVHQVLGFERLQGGTQTDRVMAMGSALNEHLLLTARYGRQVMGEEQYRRALFRQIRIALRWQLKQVPNPRRLRSAEFFEYHANLLRELERANGGRSRSLTGYVEVVRFLLRRGSLARRYAREASSAGDARA